MDATIGAVTGGIIGLLIVAVIGGLVGFLASRIVRGSGLGLLGDIALGIAGAWVATFAMRLLGFESTGTGALGTVVGFAAMIAGAVVLLLIVRMIKRA